MALGRGAALVLAALVLFGAALRWRAADHPYISQWDEAYHALVARNLASHPLTPTLYDDKLLAADDREWTKAGVWMHKPPLPLWLMAGGIAAFGEGELSFRLPAVVLDSAAIVLVFLLALELFGAALPGLLAAGLYAVNPLMIRLVSGRIPDDTPHVVSAFFITLTVLLFAVSARKNSRPIAAAAGLSLGLGTLCMSAVALLGLAAPLPLLVSSRGPRGAVRLLSIAFVFVLLSAAPWPLYCLSRWPELWRFESALHVRHLIEALDGHAHAWWWYLKIMPVQYGGFPVLVWGLAAAAAGWAVREAARRRDAGLASALVWLMLPYAFFSVIATKLYAYVSVATPAVCLLAGFGLASAWEARLRPAALAVLVLAAVQAGTVATERVRADYSAAPWNEVYDYPAFRRVMLELRKVPGPKVLLGVRDSKSPQAMYYSRAPAYPDSPEPALVRALLSRGVRVFVLVEEDKRGADIPAALRAAEFRGRVSFVPLPAPRALDARHPYEA